MSSLLIKNARYLGDSVDLLVADGKVQSLSPSIDAPADAEVVDAAGKILFPSFIDVHTHLREPGYEWKETVATGLSSAAHGGFGAILCMANTDPVNDDAAVTEQILESARRSWPHLCRKENGEGFATAEGGGCGGSGDRTEENWAFPRPVSRGRVSRGGRLAAVA